MMNLPNYTKITPGPNLCSAVVIENFEHIEHSNQLVPTSFVIKNMTHCNKLSSHFLIK